MRGIILAAGKGKRLKKVLNDRPKCLLKFGTKTLIMAQIEALAHQGVREFIIVVGYEKQQIINHVKNLPYTFHFIENPIYDRTNTIYSLWLTRKFFDDDFIYFNADVLFDSRIIERLISFSEYSTLACNPSKCGEEEVKVILDNNYIKKIGKKLPANQCYGEFIGIAKFHRQDTKRFAEILDTCIENKALWNNFFEYAVEILAQEKSLIAVDIADLPATEIDFPEDLEYARSVIYPQLT